MTQGAPGSPAAPGRPIRPPASRRWLFGGGWLAGGALISASLAGTLGEDGAWIALAVAIVLLAGTAAGAFIQSCGFLARPVNAAAGLAREVLLTFDDGPDPETTPQVLQLLQRHGHRATFFVIGERAARHPGLVARIAAEGHAVALHTMRHAWHTCFWSPARLVADLQRTRAVIEQAGAPATPAFRPPVAVLSPRIERAAALAGLQLAGYSTRALDATPRPSVDRSLRRLQRGLRPGAILALHDTARSCGPRLLPALLEALQRAGLRSVSWPQAFARPAPEATPPAKALRNEARR